MFEKIKISSIKGADYNPRFLSDEARLNLIKSLKDFGQIKPIIVRKENNTIVAGHQRTKILTELGFEYVDAIFLKDVSQQDEVRFNQLHNLCEVEVNSLQPIVCVPKSKTTGYVIVKNKDIIITKKNGLGAILSELSNLILRYGNFGSCVCNNNGEVIVSAMYANATKLLGLDLLCYYIKNEDTENCINTFKKDYGVFNYEHLEKKTYVQTWAQMKRLKGVGQLKSVLYETKVIPFILKNKSLRYLDFGSGEGAYAEKLRKQGYNVCDLEFYRKINGKNTIDKNKVLSDFELLKQDVLKNGLFDVIICDSVLNSVDSLKAEKSVLITLNALCKHNGTIFWSGRPPDKRCDMKKTNGGSFTLYFTDENLFTANYKNGFWFYQKFHNDKMINELNSKYISENYELSKNSTSFQVQSKKCKKITEEELTNALNFEFSLPLPNVSYTIFKDNESFFKKIIQWNTQ
jgi:ParB family chromosome partitioning protein